MTMIPKAPEFDFIRTLCSGKTDAELRQADEAFMAYIEMIVRQCERLRDARELSDSA